MTWEEFKTRVAATTSLPKWLRDAVAGFDSPGAPASTPGGYTGHTAAEFRQLLDIARNSRHGFPVRQEVAQVDVDYPAPGPFVICTDFGIGVVSYVTAAGDLIENRPITDQPMLIGLRRITSFRPINCRIETNMTPAGQGQIHVPRLLLTW